jgi:phosphoglycolate phosphatase-like HAD superfamily hydrolase
MRRITLGVFILLGLSLTQCRTPEKKDTSAVAGTSTVANPLPSWNDASAQRISQWVSAATDTASASFIPVADRIAVFDNDGTLWPEQPYPNQVQFAFNYLQALEPAHPEWKKDPVINGLLNNDYEPLKKAGMKGLGKVMAMTHSGMPTDSFSYAVKQWIDTAKDQRFGKRYKDLVYQPMLELLEYLRNHQFKTYIVSGGGADFMRPWTESVYGIPPYQVIGSYGEVKYEVKNDKPVLTKVAGDFYVDDKAGKPVAIHRFIGKVPVFCGGNSDGDQAMMQYTHGSPYKSFCLIVHHTDDKREYAYDTKTLSGHLETALQEASQKNWLVVDMKNDWKKVFPFE